MQSWFDTNRRDDSDHGSIDTREEVERADPKIAALIKEALGDVAWRYKKPSRRTPAELAVLGAFPDPLPKFSWPARITELMPKPSAALEIYALQPIPGTLPRSPVSSVAVTVVVENTGDETIAWDWVDFEGKLQHYGTIAPGRSWTQSTYAEHVWVVSRGQEMGSLQPSPKYNVARLGARNEWDASLL